MSLLTRHLAVVVSSALFAGLLGGQVAQAPTAGAASGRKAAVNVPAQGAGAVPKDRAEPTLTKAARSVWPKQAHRTVDLASLTAGKSRPVAPSTKDAESVVSVGPAPLRDKAASGALTPAPAKVDVKVLDKDRLASVGGTGLGVQLTRLDGRGAPGPVKVTLDYSGFKNAYGGNFASRLRLVALPACAVTTPDKKGCSALKPTSVPISNDVKTGTITATVQADGDPEAGVSVLDKTGSGSATLMSASTADSGTVYAMAATAASDAGDYRASTLKPTGSWNVSTGSGAFTYNLPITVPKPPMGSAPGLGLSYNSQAVDGMTSAVNTQASWSGLGWDLGIGFIERRYRSCQSDGTGTGWVGDLCWDSPNYDKEHDGAAYVISLNGTTSNLIQDNDGTGWYHVQDDPGWRVQHLTGGHGSDDEYWVVSAQDGTRYYFGWGRSERTPTAKTDSVLTVPVFGNDAGEPGYNGGVGVSQQAYRWGMDRVVDSNEVETAYFYEKEQNSYRSVLLTDQARQYDAAAYPVRIEYGWASQITGAQLPAKVDLTYVGRCAERMADTDPLAKEPDPCPAISSHPDSYPDVPTDLMCDGTAADEGCRTITGETYSPTFFATKMLWDIKTFVRDDDNSAWAPAMQYQMKYGLPNPDGTIDANLWLDYVQRKGYGDGEDITLPTININGEWRDNQLGGGVLNFRRVTQIHGDLGAFTNVTYRNYDDQDTCDIDNPPSESNNTLACFKQKWVPEGATEARTGWFKKYVVAQVSVDPGPAAGAGNDGDPVMTTTYDYVGKPAWAFPNDPLTKDEDESWTEWRGYQQVEVHTGTKDNAASTYYWLYRGMDGDRTSKDDPSLTRSVTVDDGDSGNAAVPDHPWLQGKVLESSDRDGDGQSHKRVWHEYWSYDTAQYDGLPDARFVRESKTTTDELTSAGWREHVVKDEYDTAEPASTKYGLPLRTNDWGLTATDDNRCTTYGRAYNTDLYPGTDVQRWMVLPDETRHYAADCADRAAANQDTYTVNLYDGATSVDTNKPADGNATAVRKYTDAGAFRETKSSFDDAGRLTSVTNAKQKTTTTQYLPTTSWPVDGVKVTTPDPDGAGTATPQSTTTWYSRLWGTAYRIQDPNGQTTRVVYDSVGRTAQVFKPSQISAYPDGTPSVQYTYTITATANSEGVPDLVGSVPPKVTTTQLQSGSTFLTSYTYIDGLGRTRETQTQAPTGTGRTAVTTRYDTSGNVTGTSAPFYNSGSAGSGMVLPTVDSLPSYTDLLIDYAGRTTQTRLMSLGNTQLQNQQSINYRGDYTTSVPAVGERTNTYTDVFGQTTKVVEFGPSTYTTSYAYDRSGHLTKLTDSKGNITGYTYNWLGERLTSDDPDAGDSTTTYDDNGNIATSKDGNNSTLSFTYDSLDRPLTVEQSGTVLTRNTYDSSTGGIGKPATSTSYANGYAYTQEATSYNADGLPTAAKATIPTDGSGLQGTYKVNYGYDAAGHQTSVSYPDAVAGLPVETVTSTYDTSGLPEKLTSSLGATYVDSTGFDALGRLADRTYGTTASTTTTAKRTYTYDDATGTGWLSRITTTSSTKGTVQDDAYLRDAGGQITDLTDKTTSQHECFTYDELNRITKAWTTQASTACTGPFTTDLASSLDPYQLDYTYDGIGNLQKATSTTATGSAVRDYVYPGYSADQATYTPGAPRPHAVSTVKTPTGTDSYSYDNAGQMTSRTVDGKSTTYVWNALGRLTSTTGASTTGYVYDADGTLLIRKGATESVLYLGGQEFHKAGSAAVKGTRYYTAGSSAVAMRVAGTSGNGKLTWLMADQQSSTQLAVDTATGAPTRRRYLPFGAQRGTAGLPAGADRGFLGKAEDPDTDLSVLGARMYDAQLGRFLSPDPLSAPYEPQSLNAYSYSDNNPITLSDPSGLRPLGPGDNDNENRQWALERHVDYYGFEGSDGTTWRQGHWGGGPGGSGRVDWVVPGTAARKTLQAPHTEITNLTHYAEPSPLFVFAVSMVAGPELTLLMAIDCAKSGDKEACTQLAITAAAKLVHINAGTRGTTSTGGKGASPCSFSADTKVLLAKGKKKAIAKIKPGDRVEAADQNDGKHKGARTVVGTIRHRDNDLVDLRIRDRDGHTSTLHTTAKHPFWDDTRHAWIPASKLTVGHQLNTADDQHAEIVGVKSVNGAAEMYNLTVDELHTYYVLAGTTPVLVHNTPPGTCSIISAADAPVINSKTVYTSKDRSFRVDIENQNPGKPGAGIHLQFMGRGADPKKYYFDPANGNWRTESGEFLSSRTAKQVPQSAINKAYKFFGVDAP
ncbi:polymorphic toxin-type HINT domain-containing protein [Streptomyces sp. NBC_00638]|uniref:polymorphic toxin-type HINT domain-containing protein n=1 Tax=Streptomyces sp. NBC_00638 TaxID=2975794 RepID=UPI002257A255|nr:polymorphic toxin-type HINT domain-containing protein [Streptomyces sp. NBC_00638]MCX5009198.1 polymorphic toxin-type HINT domain-containing protein [Streptomyces sp. NBC_00638]